MQQLRSAASFLDAATYCGAMIQDSCIGGAFSLTHSFPSIIGRRRDRLGFMTRKSRQGFAFSAALLAVLFAHHAARADETPDRPAEIRVGIIGLDTSHVLRFTELLNAEEPLLELAGCRVVAAYPKGSEDIESSVSRVPGYIEQVRLMGVEIVPSIDELLELVDAVLLESNDGRVHLRQALPVLKSGKPMFIDKPMAASLVDVIAIYEAAKHFETPIFSTSALRYGSGTLEVHGGSIGKVLGCDVYSPCALEPTHPDFFWYGIHGVEALFTVMGTGCQAVARTQTKDAEFAVGVWSEGRVGTFRGMRAGAQQYGGIAFGESANQEVGEYEGYEPLVIDIAKFFRHGNPPTSEEETIEIFAFMEAADESKRQGGVPISVPELIAQARQKAQQKRTW